ncbi:MAG: glycosyltransferase family 4 protein [Bacteroidota bacterium]
MTDKFRKVLIIAYYFPPMGLSGVQRTVKFAKYLSRYGWKPTVLTVEPTGYYAFDESQLKEVEEAGVPVIRTRSLDANHLFKRKSVVKMPSEWLRKLLQFFGDFFFIPDTKIGWKSYAVKAAREVMAKEHFDLLFATAPPQTAFLIGAALKKKFTTPLVLDYRDAWLDYPFKYFPTPIHWFLHKRLEKKVLKAGDKVIVTHRRVKEGLLKRYPTLSYHDVTIISHGYDPEDFAGGSAEKKSRLNKMRIAHAGTFYGKRTPTVLFHALANLLKARQDLRGRIELNFVGTIRKEDQALVSKLGLQNDVTFQGYLEHRECVRQLLSADVLWYVVDNDYQSPGKLYEYFGARKPIFASVVEGYTRQLILESEAALCVPLEDTAAHEQALLDLINQFDEKKLKRPSEGFASKFNRATLTGELAKQFESLMDYDKNAFVLVREQPE